MHITLERVWWAKKENLSELVNCSASDRLGRNFPTVPNGLEKSYKLYLIKLVSKYKWAIRKEHTSFFLFYFWDLKLVPIDSALNFVSQNVTHSFQKCKRGTKKSSQIWKSGLKLFWNVLSSIAAKLENGGAKIFFTGGWLEIVWMK